MTRLLARKRNHHRNQAKAFLCLVTSWHFGRFKTSLSRGFRVLIFHLFCFCSIFCVLLPSLFLARRLTQYSFFLTLHIVCLSVCMSFCHIWEILSLSCPSANSTFLCRLHPLWFYCFTSSLKLKVKIWQRFVLILPMHCLCIFYLFIYFWRLEKNNGMWIHEERY